MTDQPVVTTDDIVRATFIVKLRGRRYAKHAVLIKRRRSEQYVQLTLFHTDTNHIIELLYVDRDLADTELRMEATNMLREATVLTP